MHEIIRTAAAVLLLLVSACSMDPQTGPGDTRWDRQSCERCRMMLSDRHYAAQVRVFPEANRSRVFYFDDIGCAIIWLQDKPWEANKATEIWVTDHRTGEWIDARAASYVENRITPMEYGLGAQREAAAEAIDFSAARAHVLSKEAQFHAHSRHLLDQLKAESKQPDTADDG